VLGTELGAEAGVTEREREIGERQSVAVLSGGELDEGKRATMWVSPHIFNII